MNAPTTVARLSCDEPIARRLAAFLGESLDAADSACAAFEDDAGRWQVAIHFRTMPDEASLRDLVRLVAGETAADALSIEPVAANDWVAESLAGLKPVRAGRFVVHGAHDRAGHPQFRVVRMRSHDQNIEHGVFLRQNGLWRHRRYDSRQSARNYIPPSAAVLAADPNT